MQLHQFDELPVAGLWASRLPGAIEKIHDVIAGGTALATAVRDEKDIALAEKNWRQVGKPAGALFAAVVPEDGGKWTLAFWFVEEAVENQVSTGKSDFDGRGRRLCEGGYWRTDEESE
jgi:hypothetical protein